MLLYDVRVYDVSGNLVYGLTTGSKERADEAIARWSVDDYDVCVSELNSDPVLH